MSEQSRTRRWVGWLLRLTITLICVGFVVRIVSNGWEDQLQDPDKKEPSYIRGWVVKDAQGVNKFRADDGRVLDIPPEPKDPRIPSPLIAGFVTLLKQCKIHWLLGGILLQPLAVIMAAFRWRWLLLTHGIEPGIFEAVKLTYAGNFANNFLPGATGGDLIKGVMIYRRAPGKRIEAAMTVLFDRVLGLISLLLLGGAAVLIMRHRPELANSAKFVASVLLLALVGGVVYFSARLRRVLFIDTLINNLPFQKQVQALDKSIFHFRNHWPCLLQCLAVSLMIHGCTIVCVWMLGKSLNLKIDMIYYAVYLPVIFTTSAVIPAIAGLGVLEGLFQQFFSLVGNTPPSNAVALCLLYRLMTLVNGLPGAIPFIRARQVKPTGLRLESADVAAPVSDAGNTSHVAGFDHVSESFSVNKT